MLIFKILKFNFNNVRKFFKKIKEEFVSTDLFKKATYSEGFTDQNKRAPISEQAKLILVKDLSKEKDK